MKTHDSTENYLETILILGRQESKVRSIDIAQRLDFSKPSVSVAIKKLCSEGYVEVDNGNITLTEKGREIAESIYEKHTVISEWLIFLGVDKQTAVSDACRMEHAISDQSFQAMKDHIQNWKQSIYSGKQDKQLR